MYVRWQSRSRLRRGKSPLITAELVECRRVDGKPRQRLLAYLGGIREAYVDEREGKHRAFWRGVDERLDTLGLDPETRARVEASVESRVRRVTPENQAEFDAAEARIKLEMAAVIASL